MAQTLVAVMITGAACGCGSADTPDSANAARQLKRLLPPTTAQCAAKELQADKPPESLVPLAGTFSYRLKGRETVTGEHRRVRPFPDRMTVTVTSSVRSSNLLCFRLQRRETTSLSETATFVVRGSDVFVTEFLLESDNGFVLLQPQPPLLALSSDELEWSGSFTGPTRGQYVGRILGRRTMRVGDRRVRAVGVVLDTSLAGEVRGVQHSVRWFSLDRHLILSERDSEWRHDGLDRLRIDYSAELESLRPRGAR